MQSDSSWLREQRLSVDKVVRTHVACFSKLGTLAVCFFYRIGGLFAYSTAAHW